MAAALTPRPALALALLLALCACLTAAASSGSTSDSLDAWEVDNGSGSTEFDLDEVSNMTATEVLSSAKGIKVGPGILAALAIVGGGVVTVLGYRLFRPTVFLCGFIVGGLFVAGIIEAIFKDEDWLPTASWVAFAIGGLIAGGLVVYLYAASIFLGGAAGGVLLAFSLNTSFGAKIYPNNPDVVLVVMAVLLGVIGGVLALKLEKPVLVVATSFVGAEVLVWGIGYFAGDYPNGADLKAFRAKNDDGDWVYDIPDAWWAYLAGILVVFLLGMLIQFKKTARGHHHGGKSSSSQALAKPTGTTAV
jgi:hypothetical protein